MIEITSVNNEVVKETAKLLQKKYREETKLFLVDGVNGVTEAVNSGIELVRVFCDTKTQINGINEEIIIKTTEAVLSKISDTKTAPPIVAVAKQKTQNITDLKHANKVILLEGIKDAGNLGTIIRSSVAFGIDAIILYGDTIDLYNPKCVRSTVGNLWKIPIYATKDFDILNKYFKDYERIATLPKGENIVPLKEYTPKENVLLMFGSEANGLSTELKEFANKNITIEMKNTVESLNLSTSVSLIAYKIMN
ncbi:MAG: RNA methyltransferase [bacterium]|nr:RNA methyltransferase [bacterium]